MTPDTGKETAPTSGKGIAIGIDLHAATATAFAVPVDEKDIEASEICRDFNRGFKSFRVDRKRFEDMAELLKDVEHCILIENSTKTHDVYWTLVDLGCQVMVANAADLFRITMSVQKTDYHDCMELAGYMRRRLLGEREFAESFIVDDVWMNRRQICRIYAQESEILSNCRRQIRSHMLLHGITLDKAVNDIASASNLKKLEMNADDALKLLIQRARDSKSRMVACEGAIRKEFSEEPMFELVYSIPGFGLVTTAYIVSMVVDIDRFRSPGGFAAYFGIVPKQRESAETKPCCHITRRGDAKAREMLTMATFVHIINDKDGVSGVTRTYNNLRARGMPHKKALMAAANKMARVVYAVLKSRKGYKDSK